MPASSDCTRARRLPLRLSTVVFACVDPDIEVPRLDRLATKLLWARGDWPAFRSEAVPLFRVDEDEMDERILESAPKATLLKTHYRSTQLLSRLVSPEQLEDLGARRAAFTRGPFVFHVGENPVTVLDTRDGVWWRRENPDARRRALEQLLATPRHRGERSLQLPQISKATNMALRTKKSPKARRGLGEVCC